MVYCVQRQYLPVVRGYGAKVNVGAGHATFTGLRTGKTTSTLIFISNKKIITHYAQSMCRKIEEIISVYQPQHPSHLLIINIIMIAIITISLVLIFS